MAQFCGSTPEEWAVNPHCYMYEADGVTKNPAAEACYRQKDPATGVSLDNAVKTSASTDTDSAIRDYDNGLWHHLVLTTRPDGQKGYNQYLDGVLRAASPYVEGVGLNKGYGDPSYANHMGVGGSPIDPAGYIRLCGRKKPSTWKDMMNDESDAEVAVYDPKRYFRGKVAHFSVWNSALSQDQVNDLHKSYVDKYGLTVTPFKMPAMIPKPMAYYFMDEGHGRNLKESMTQDSTAGQVDFVDETEADVHPNELDDDDSTDDMSNLVHYTHQFNTTNDPNWVHDAYFGSTIACGEITEHSHQKDFITLADVDYGRHGKWAMSVWYRHTRGDNFDGYQREQFFGHGDPAFPTSARNQIHIQFEKSDRIRTMVKDSKDMDRYTRPCMKKWCPSDAYNAENPSCTQSKRSL